MSIRNRQDGKRVHKKANPIVVVWAVYSGKGLKEVFSKKKPFPNVFTSVAHGSILNNIVGCIAFPYISNFASPINGPKSLNMRMSRFAKNNLTKLLAVIIVQYAVHTATVNFISTVGLYVQLLNLFTGRSGVARI